MRRSLAIAGARCTTGAGEAEAAGGAVVHRTAGEQLAHRVDGIGGHLAIGRELAARDRDDARRAHGDLVAA